MDTKNLKKAISAKLAYLLKNSGRTLEATAYSLDMHLSQYYKLLKGERLPSMPTLMRINKLYDINMDWWFKDIKEVPSPRHRELKNPLEFQLVNTFKKLNPHAQKTVLATVKTLARRLK